MSKKNLLLGGVLVILIILAYLYQGPLNTWKEMFLSPRNFLAKVDFKEVNKIEVTNNGVTTVLEKRDLDWKVSDTKDFYVKRTVADSIARAFEEIGNLKLELASENKDKMKDFQTDESGIAVKLLMGDELKADFIVGKLASDYLSTYIAKVNSDKTYSVKANLFIPFNQSDWRDNTIFASDKTAINKIRFQYPTREFTVTKGETGWSGTIPYLFSVDDEKVEEVVEIMSNLEAIKIPVQDFSNTGLEKNLIIVQATGENFDNTIMVGEADEEGLYYAKRANSDNIYLITEKQRKVLNKIISELE